MLTADRVDFMVSFTRWSGVQLLIPPLQELAKRHVPVRIITSTYMGITEPKALRHLLQFENVELRIVNEYKKSFHTKAYLFERCSGQHSVIVGSSNLSQAALTTGYELNVRLPETRYLPVYQQTKDLFDTVWNEKTQPVDEQFYKPMRNSSWKPKGKCFLCCSKLSLQNENVPEFHAKGSITKP